MNFSSIFKKATKPSTPVDAYAIVNGKPSNDTICEDMLSGVSKSPEVTEHVKGIARGMGFSAEEANFFWG